VNVSRTVIAVYAIAGCSRRSAGPAGRAIGAASPLVGDAIIFDAAAAVLLGHELRRWHRRVGGTAVGVLFLPRSRTGSLVAGVASFWQQLIPARSSSSPSCSTSSSARGRPAVGAAAAEPPGRRRRAPGPRGRGAGHPGGGR
jgi:hypothetical protein